MDEKIKVLFVEKSSTDVVEMLNVINDKFKVVSRIVNDEINLKKALLETEWDVVISSYIIPTISAIEVLGVVKEIDRTLPVIVVTEMKTYPIAMELIKAGVVDVVTKDNLMPLAVVIEKEIKKKNEIITKKVDSPIFGTAPPFSLEIKLFSLQAKFILGLFVVAFLIFIIGIFMVFKSIKGISLYSENNAVLLAKSAMSGLENALKKNKNEDDNEWLNNYSREIKQKTGHTIMVIDEKNVILVGPSEVRGSKYKSLMPNYKPLPLDNRSTQSRIEKVGSIIMNVMYFPVTINDKPAWMIIDYRNERVVLYKNYIQIISILFIIVFLGIFGVFLGIAYGSKKLVLPLKEMEKIAEELKSENLERKSNEKLLHMVNQKMTQWVAELEWKTREIKILNEMARALNSCGNDMEFYSTATKFLKQLFQKESGVIYILDESGKYFEAVVKWGEKTLTDSFGVGDCWAMRTGREYNIHGDAANSILCGHMKEKEIYNGNINTTCIPMVSFGGIVGIFHMCKVAEPTVVNTVAESRTEERQYLVFTIVESITQLLSNMRSKNLYARESINDSLTGLYNRNYMNISMQKAIYMAKRHGVNFGIIMLDIDKFKEFNDKFGHLVGDMLLKALGKMIHNQMRPEDYPCRYGGDEFLIILLGEGREGTKLCAERILREARNIRLDDSEEMKQITISLGFSVYPEDGTTEEDLIKSADMALLSAKTAGRNCVVEGKKQT